MTMRIAYLSHIDVRSPRAHVHNSLKTCEALQAAGDDVTFINPDMAPADLDAILRAHDIRTPFQMRFLGRVGAQEQNQPSRIKRVFAVVRMIASLNGYLWRHRKEIDVVYYRYHLLLKPALFAKWILRKRVVFESHYVYLAKPIAQSITNAAVHSADGVVAITDALRKHYVLSDERSVMAPCHAAEFEHVPIEDTATLRRDLDLPSDKIILCYTGSLGATIQGISYEVETMVDVLKDLPTNVISLIVGARSDRPDGEDLRKRAEKLGVADRVIIRPWSDRTTVMKYLAASDVLVMPRVGTAPGSSPSKMFDYLAIAKPIVAASTPPVDEILTDGENALLVDADKPEQWTSAISRVLSDKQLAEKLHDGAMATGRRYTWAERGKTIHAFLERIYAIPR